MKFYKYLIYLVIFILVPGTILAVNDNAIKVELSKSEISVGDKVTLTIYVSSPDEAINAISGKLIFSNNLNFVDINKQDSIISFWIEDPVISPGMISFEGVKLGDGYKGNLGKIFQVVFSAKKEGLVNFYIKEGSILTNDGMGTNILEHLGSINLKIKKELFVIENENNKILESKKTLALPVITDYKESIISNEKLYLKGKGEPNVITKIIFNDVSIKSLGERFINLLQNKKKIDSFLVNNNSHGIFEFSLKDNLLAGVYNVTPFLLDQDTQVEKSGPSVQLLINDNKTVKFLVILINVLALMVPIVGLIVILYFIPWYSWRRIRILKKKLGVEEKKIEISEYKTSHQIEILNKDSTYKIFPDER